ncbi:MAG: hypothetical protein EB127_23090 [Alphaproteobacteria bacterium]|nr:hypothetical protein [Alphaproteobacteria bacterium]
MYPYNILSGESKEKKDNQVVINEQEIIRSRRGYDARELVHSFLTNIVTTGPLANGKLLHYTADIVCSGGLELLQKLCWDFAFDHIGIAQPRIFVFLKKRCQDINAISLRQTPETFMYSAENQRLLAEMVLVLQACARRTKPKIPVVSHETHENELWLRSSLRAPEKEAVKKIWKHGSDQPQLYHAGNEIIHACGEGATERALWWLRWLLEEDGLVCKRNNMGLTSIDRGGAGGKSRKKGLVGGYIVGICAEAYKEAASRGQVKLHEEFQCLIDLHRDGGLVGLGSARRRDCLALMIQILSEVPRWRNPTSPPLLTMATINPSILPGTPGQQSSGTDDILLARAVGQAEVFFREILALPPLKKSLTTAIRAKTKKKVSANIVDKLTLTENIYLDMYGLK